MALKIDAKFEGKLTCAFKNDMKNWQPSRQILVQCLVLSIEKLP